MWQTHITVAAIIEQQQKFLLVTDLTQQGLKLNQPAGHVEAHEDIITAVIREVKEESSLDFIPQQLVGIYLYNPNPENTYLRFCFRGKVKDYSQTPQPLPTDDGVVAAEWYDLAQIRARSAEHRSPLVLCCIEDYLAGKAFPMEILANYPSNNHI